MAWVEDTGKSNTYTKYYYDNANANHQALESRVYATADDGTNWVGQEFSTGYCRAGTWYGTTMSCYFRWLGITIPVSTINAAYIKCSGYDTAGSPKMKIYGADSDNPSAPTTAAQYTGIAVTTAAVDWDVNFNTGVKDGNQSPDIATVIQELVNSYTISNEALMLLLKDDGSAIGSDNYNIAFDYTNETSWATLLRVEFTISTAKAVVFNRRPRYMWRRIR
jgi:hypothetical protein